MVLNKEFESGCYMLTEIGAGLGYTPWKSLRSCAQEIRVSKLSAQAATKVRLGISLVKLSVIIFWVVVPCCLVGAFQHFGGLYHLCLSSP
jgi:hypothetical protein